MQARLYWIIDLVYNSSHMTLPVEVDRLHLFRRDVFPDDQRTLQHIRGLGISNVLYPGCGTDSSLDSVFEQGLTRFDNNPTHHPPLVLDLKDAPRYFKNQRFDGLYLKGLHINASDLENLLGLVRSGGLVIFHPHMKRLLGGAYGQYLATRKHLARLPLPFNRTLLQVYRIDQSVEESEQ